MSRSVIYLGATLLINALPLTTIPGAFSRLKVKSIPETGRNTFHGYNYASVEDVLNAVRPICCEHGVFISINCVSHEILKDGRAASVVVQLTLTDIESGESVTSQCPGYSEDPKSDKSLWKAISGASKYVIRTFFALASGGDDPELEDAPEPATTNPLSGANGRHHTKPVTSKNPLDPDLHPQPTQRQTPPPAPATPAANGDTAAALIEATSEQMRRIGWDVGQGRRFLQENFGVSTRKHLTPVQLQQFSDYLRALPSESARTPALST